MTTFCWLPPESTRTGVSMSGVRICSSVTYRWARARSCPDGDEEAREDRARSSTIATFSRTERFATSPAPLPVLGYEGEARRNRVPRGARRARDDRPRGLRLPDAGLQAEQRGEQGGPTGPDEPGEADDLTGMQCEVDGLW